MNSIFQRIRQILEAAKTGAVRSVNTAQVAANWLIGREIVEEEQKGKARAGYGEKLIAGLSAQISAEYGKGYSVNNLEYFRKFYLTYPELLENSISHAVRGESGKSLGSVSSEKSDAVRRKLDTSLDRLEIQRTEGSTAWKPGRFWVG